MPKKDKKAGKEASAAEAEPVGASGPWRCAECEQDNEAADEVCCACEEPRPATEPAEGARFKGYVVGLVISAEKVPNKDKLTVVQVDVGAEEPLQVVTNAPNAVEGARVVVATVGATFAGSSGEDEVVKKGAVGGVMSHGMLCNAPMLGWKGGDARCAATLPEEWAVGGPPPAERPRGGKDA
mmetsp:Transcript_1451/g.3935  ORF Transcript_1451/g.3935 Transcript_1451/m.3935 type:complete len:182 (-) Transcript_1451:7-552(-)